MQWYHFNATQNPTYVQKKKKKWIAEAELGCQMTFCYIHRWQICQPMSSTHTWCGHSHHLCRLLSEQNTCAQHSSCPAEKNNRGSRAAEKLVSLFRGEFCLRTEASWIQSCSPGQKIVLHKPVQIQMRARVSPTKVSKIKASYSWCFNCCDLGVFWHKRFIGFRNSLPSHRSVWEHGHTHTHTPHASVRRTAGLEQCLHFLE